MLPDDVFRERLEQTLMGLEAWAESTRDVASVNISASPHYWRMAVVPETEGACPFELLLKSTQTFGLKLGEEVYENERIEDFSIFSKIVHAVADGQVALVEIFNAQTELLLGLATKVVLSDGTTWMRERRVTPRPMPALEILEERRDRWYLPYRR